jgi:hypothetical protein
MKTATDSCTHNSECEMQGSTQPQCALVNDFTTGRSYGTLLCQTCPSRPVCHITDGSSGVGKCSCLQQGMRVSSCVAAAQFTTIFLDASAMCAVSTDANTVRGMSAYFTWGSLATAPCAILNSQNAQCSRTDEMGYVVVGHGVHSTSFLGRRLLTDSGSDTEDWQLASEILGFDSWNHTAEPCRMLANAYLRGDHVSITEEAHLESCVKSRQFGNWTINSLNMTRLAGHDNFLMSFTDFARVASERGVLRQLVNTTGLVRFLITESSVVKPWLSIIKSIMQSAAVVFEERIKSLPRNLTNATFPEYTNFFVPVQAIGMHLLDPLSTKNADIRMYMDKVGLPDSSVLTSILHTMEPKTSTHARTLLQLDESVSRYSSLTAATNGFSNIPLASSLADNWLEGPFGWPPKINSHYWDGDQVCTAAQVSLDVIAESGLVMDKFFREYAISRRELSWGIVQNIPTLYNGTLPDGFQYPANWTNTSFTLSAPGTDWPSVFFSFLGQNVVENYLGITADRIVLFFTTLPAIPRDMLTARNLAKDMLMCDFESVMLCSRHNR